MVYDINIKKIKHKYFSSILLILIGFITCSFLLIHYFSIYNVKKNLNGVATASQVEWLNKSNILLEYYSPIYYYEVEEQTYICKSNEYTTFKDKNNTVYYDINNPVECLTGLDDYIANLILYLLIVPGVLIILGIVILLQKWKKNKLIKHLAIYGTLVRNIPYQAYSTEKKENDKVIKYLCVRYTLPNGKKQIFRSNYFPDNTCKNEGTCDLLFDEEHSNNYFIDFNIKTTGRGEPKIIEYSDVE